MKSNIIIRNNIRKILSQHILEALEMGPLISQRVEWNSESRSGKKEGLTKGQIIYAIGDEEFCKIVQKQMEKTQLEKGSESYSYMIAHSQSRPGDYVLIQNWEGFYD